MKRGYQKLEDYANSDTDNFIYQIRKRRKEVEERETDVKEGAPSELLSPLVGERVRRIWVSSKLLPDFLYVQKPMGIKQAQDEFGIDEVAPYIKETSFKYIRPLKD